jgi:hypothetical protein
LPQTALGFSLNVNNINGYKAGYSDIYITLGSGKYIVALDNTKYALQFSGSNNGDTITFTNNGTVAGRGGQGSRWDSQNGTGNTWADQTGGPGLLVNTLITIKVVNNGTIGGGGGGGSPGAGGGGAAFGGYGQNKYIDYTGVGISGTGYWVTVFGNNGNLLTGGNGSNNSTGNKGGSLGEAGWSYGYPGGGGPAGVSITGMSKVSLFSGNQPKGVTKP